MFSSLATCCRVSSIVWSRRRIDEVRRARVVERGAGLGTAGEELLAEPGEVGDLMTPGLVGERPRVERLRDRRGAGPGCAPGPSCRPGPTSAAPRGPARTGRRPPSPKAAGGPARGSPRCPGSLPPRRRRCGPPGFRRRGRAEAARGRCLAGRRRYDDRKTRGHDQEAGQDAVPAHGSRSDLRSSITSDLARPAHLAAPAGPPSGTIRKSTCPSWTTAPVPIGASYRTRPATGAAILQRPI